VYKCEGKIEINLILYFSEINQTLLETAIQRRRTIILIHNCCYEKLRNVFTPSLETREEEPIFMSFVRPNHIQMTSIQTNDVFKWRRKQFVNNLIERRDVLQKARMEINKNHNISLV